MSGSIIKGWSQWLPENGELLASHLLAQGKPRDIVGAMVLALEQAQCSSAVRFSHLSGKLDSEVDPWCC